MCGQAVTPTGCDPDGMTPTAELALLRVKRKIIVARFSEPTAEGRTRSARRAERRWKIRLDEVRWLVTAFSGRGVLAGKWARSAASTYPEHAKSFTQDNLQGFQRAS